MADYEKDQRDGLVNTLAGHHRRRDAGPDVERLLRNASCPTDAQRCEMADELMALGELPSLFQWINEMLLARVGDGLSLRRHPAGPQGPATPSPRPLVSAELALGGAACSER